MSIIVRRRRPTVGVASRAMMACAGLVLLATAAWFATSWIDTGEDSTCGAVIHPTMWLSDDAPKSCAAVMAVRTAIAAATIGFASLLLGMAASANVPRSIATARVILVVSCAAALTMLVANEAVRSDGAF